MLIGLAKDGHVIVPPFLESDAAGAAVQVEAGFDACNGAFFDEGAQTTLRCQKTGAFCHLFLGKTITFTDRKRNQQISKVGEPNDRFAHVLCGHAADLDGVAETYAYLATTTFPYTVGCFGPSDFPVRKTYLLCDAILY